MISTAKRKAGSSAASLVYMLGGKLEKDQLVRVIDYNGFALSRRMLSSIESVPNNEVEREEHKQEIREIAQSLAMVFDARSSQADYRVADPFEDYIISFVDEERERLRRIPTTDEKKAYQISEQEDRPLEKIICEEFLERIGVHGNIEVKLRRKKNGQKYTVTQTQQREALYLVVAHDGTRHPHFHIFTARPDANGKVNDTRDERYRILKAVREISKKYNLSLKLENYDVDIRKVNDGYATKLRMRDAVKAALITAANRDELQTSLAAKGVAVSWKRHGLTGAIYGICFTGTDKKGHKHTYSGSQLDRLLSFAKVENALAVNQAARLAEEQAIAVVSKSAVVQQEKKHEEEESKLKVFSSGFESIITTIWNELMDFRTNTIRLWRNVTEVNIETGNDTNEQRQKWTANWKKFFTLNDESKWGETSTNRVSAMGGMMRMFNNLVSQTAEFVSQLCRDINSFASRSQKKQLLPILDTVRSDMSRLEAKKSQVSVKNRNQFREYLEAYNCIHEYNAAKNAFDNQMRTITTEMNKQEELRQFLELNLTQKLLDDILEAYKGDGSHYHLVPGPIVETADGFRCELNTDGIRFNNSKILSRPHRPAHQDKGLSYILFRYNDKGEIEAKIESDPPNDYSAGISGKINFGSGETIIKMRDYGGTKLIHMRKTVQGRHDEMNVKFASNIGISPSRIVERRKDYFVLQNAKPGGLIRDKRYTESFWEDQISFKYFKEIGRDSSYVYFHIIGVDGEHNYINQYGNTLSAKQLRQLGIGGEDKGGGIGSH